VSGVALITIGALQDSTYSQIGTFAGSGLSKIAIVLIAVGVTIALVSLLGHLGAFLNKSSIVAGVCTECPQIGMYLSYKALSVEESGVGRWCLHCSWNHREDMEMKSCSPASESLNCITSDGNTRSTKKSGKERHFDFGSHPRRHVALKLAYLGWAYQGFAVQENTDNTVEARLFEALLKTRLIQDRQSSNYHRCGRTDKGVSAFSQDIRILDWAPVEQGFSARFDCQSRTYRYYFPRGFLDVELMADAAKSMAVDYPLVLYDCHFEGLIWQQVMEEVNHVLSSLQRHWTQSAVKAHVLLGMTRGLEERGGVSSNHCWLVEGSRQKNYRPLLERPCCESLESRINHFVKRGRLEREEGQNGDETIHRGKKSKHSHNACSPSVSSEIPKQSIDLKEED
ncbi:hypothetical protein XENOCAPTIV_012310, partial [Xenoophorus captivus]